MNGDLFVITNNPLINEKYNNRINIVLSEGKYLEILILVRNKVHEGYRLLTHPLAGSIKPNETPYRSIIVSKGGSLDFQSLEIIESSIQACERFLRDHPTPDWSERILKDFQCVDLHLFESAFIENELHM